MATRKRQGLFLRGSYWWIRTDPVTGGQKSTKCRTLDNAKIWLRARERLAADPATAAAEEAELGHWCDELVAVKKREKSESTVQVYEQKLANVLGVLGRACRLIDVTPPAVDEYVATRRGDGVTDHTIVKELGCLTQVLKLAKRSGCYPGDLAALRPLDLHTGYQPRKRALSRQEVVRLMAELEPARGALVAITVGLGLRLSEAHRILPSDVDLEGGTVFVGGTKTEGSRRHLPILSVFRSLVRAAIDHLPLKPWQNIRRDLAAACRRAGIERCTPNDLRRTHSTLLYEAGVPRDVIRRLLGHTTAAMVDRVYGKPRPEALGELAEKALLTISPIQTQQISNSESGDEPLEGASSRARTGDLRFTNPKTGSVKHASLSDSAEIEVLVERGEACVCMGVRAKAQQSIALEVPPHVARFALAEAAHRMGVLP